MDYIHRLPFILGAFAAIVVGIISCNYGLNIQDTYTKMAVSMVVFFVIGVYIRNTLERTLEEVEKKKREEEELLKQSEEENMEEVGQTANKKENESNHTVDYTVSDDDDFIPFSADEVMKNNVENKL